MVEIENKLINETYKLLNNYLFVERSQILDKIIEPLVEHVKNKFICKFIKCYCGSKDDIVPIQYMYVKEVYASYSNDFKHFNIVLKGSGLQVFDDESLDDTDKFATFDSKFSKWEICSSNMNQLINDIEHIEFITYKEYKEVINKSVDLYKQLAVV